MERSPLLSSPHRRSSASADGAAWHRIQRSRSASCFLSGRRAQFVSPAWSQARTWPPDDLAAHRGMIEPALSLKLLATWETLIGLGLLFGVFLEPHPAVVSADAGPRRVILPAGFRVRLSFMTRASYHQESRPRLRGDRRGRDRAWRPAVGEAAVSKRAEAAWFPELLAEFRAQIDAMNADQRAQLSSVLAGSARCARWMCGHSGSPSWIETPGRRCRDVSGVQRGLLERWDRRDCVRRHTRPAGQGGYSRPRPLRRLCRCVCHKTRVHLVRPHVRGAANASHAGIGQVWFHSGRRGDRPGRRVSLEMGKATMMTSSILFSLNCGRGAVVIFRCYRRSAKHCRQGQDRSDAGPVNLDTTGPVPGRSS